MEKTLSMNSFKIKSIEHRAPRHDNWDTLDREHRLILFRGKDELKYCREHYVNGVGTRNFSKLKEINFGFDSRYTVVGYTVDSKDKVLRVFVNKYRDPDGDFVSESILWPPVIGEPSKLYYYPSKEFYYG